MTILWQDGFDLYNNLGDLQLNYSSNGAGSINITGGRFGGGAFVGNTSSGFIRNIGSQTEIWSSFAVNVSLVNSIDYCMIAWGSTSGFNGGVEGMLTYNSSTGVWRLWRGYLITMLASFSAPITANAWHWIDARFKWDASAGTFELWIDDVQVQTLTGLNTVANAGTTLVNTSLGDPYGSSTLHGLFDDWMVYDTGTTRVGDMRIETVLPASDVGPNNATPSSGTNHYSLVNESQWNTSNYVTMPNTSGDKEVYSSGSISATPATVFNVKVYLVSEKSDAGSFQLEPLVISGGTESDGAAQQLLTSWGVQYAMFPVDPHTSAPWTYTAVNAADVGFKVP